MNIPENFDRWMFDYKEGNLSGAEKEAFEKFLIQNPEFEIEADAWSNSFVQTEEFVYPNAGELEKDNRFVAGWYGYAAAAIALLLIGTSVIYFNRNNASPEVEGFAANHDVVAEGLDHSSTISARDFENTHASLIEDLNDNANNESLNLAINNNNAVQVNNNNGNNIDPNVLVNNNNLNANNNFNGNNNSNNGSNGNNVLNGTNDPNVNLNGNGPDYANNNHNNEIAEPEFSANMTDPTASQLSMDQEISKFDDVDYNSKYQGNPDGSSMNFDVADVNIKYDFKNSKLKRFWRKIERMFDYPVGLTNLRDPDYLMPNNSVVASNPGFTGGMLRPRTEINYRNQWFGNEMNSQQMTLSFDNYFYQMRGGVGVQFNAKDYGYGEFGDYSMSLMYSPKIVLGKNVIFEPAVKLTLGALNANGDKLASDSDFEMDRGRILSTPAAQQMNGNQQLWYKDYGLGFVLNTKWFYAGFSADNLNQHYENVYSVEGYATPSSTPVRFNGILGADYESLNREFSLSPFVAYQKFGDRQEIWGGTSMRYKKFIVGGSAGYTTNNNVEWTASIGMKFEKFKLAYQYDQTKTTLTNQSIGSHNLTLRFNGVTKPPRLK